MGGEQTTTIGEALLSFSEQAGGFDINAAFQDALFGVASDQELQLDEKVRRMENIVAEGQSEMYQSFVDFRSLAAQMEMMCNHDHNLAEAARGSEALSGFMDSHTDHGTDEHDHNHHESKKYKKDKAKKKLGWFSVWRSSKA